MTAVTHPRDDLWTRPGQCCAFCSKPVAVPYVGWLCYPGDEDCYMVICASCCRQLKRALMADMVRVVAFDDFRRASPVSEVRQ